MGYHADDAVCEKVMIRFYLHSVPPTTQPLFTSMILAYTHELCNKIKDSFWNLQLIKKSCVLINAYFIIPPPRK